ncbi:MAG TPA: hypothetical protein VNZ22_01145 [Bacillota bacterium]|nr:hypothetical protein [Bacillota bacterium]
MKKLVLLFALTTVALGALCTVQWRKLAHQQNQIVSLQGETDQQSQQLAELASDQKRTEQQRRELLRLSDDLTAQLRARPVVPTNPPSAPPAAPVPAGSMQLSAEPKPSAGKEGFGKMLANMMQDPEMKKFIRDQQRGMLNQLYDPLIKQLGLSPEEAGKFKDLLADNMMQGAEKATSLFGGAGATNHTELVKTMAEEQKAFDEQVKAYLGEDRYNQYKDYQLTVGERTQLNQFRQQNPGDNSLTDQQTEQLLAVMKQEKQNYATTSGQPLPGTGQDQANLQAMLSGKETDKLLLAQENINQRVYDRARSVLSPAQLESFGKFQTNQLQMMRMGMSMARKFMAPETTGDAAGQ